MEMNTTWYFLLTKCSYFYDRSNDVNYPASVQLGHTLHQSVSMDMDCHRARAKFIGKTVDTRETFYFTQPHQKLKMVQLLCCDGYGSMLWDLQGDAAEQYLKC